MNEITKERHNELLKMMNFIGGVTHDSIFGGIVRFKTVVIDNVTCTITEKWIENRYFYQEYK